MYWKDENKVKKAENGPFLEKKLHDFDVEARLIDVPVQIGGKGFSEDVRRNGAAEIFGQVELERADRQLWIVVVDILATESFIFSPA